MKPPRVLIVEDNHALALALAATVRQSSATSQLAASAALARDHLMSAQYDIMILDIGLPDENGLALLKSLPAAHRPPTIVITAHGEIENTIHARKLGVSEFLTKPLDFDAFNAALDRLIKSGQRQSAVKTSKAPASALIGAAPSMRPVFQHIAHACATEDPVLIRGEIGTGKSHVADLIQRNSVRSAGRPPMRILAGTGTTLGELASQLEAARGGVITLEDITLLPPDAQSELVRQIEEATTEFPRLLATTSGGLRDAVNEGRFRSDLFYRLQVLEVRLPPLRQRIEDLPALLAYFIGQTETSRAVGVSDAVIQRLSGYAWPGNLRELRNVAAYALTVSRGAAMIEEAHLPVYLETRSREIALEEEDAQERLRNALDGWLETELAAPNPSYRELSGQLEGLLIQQLLPRYDGKVARLAAHLEANRTTLRKKLREVRGETGVYEDVD